MRPQSVTEGGEEAETDGDGDADNMDCEQNRYHSTGDSSYVFSIYGVGPPGLALSEPMPKLFYPWPVKPDPGLTENPRV